MTIAQKVSNWLLGSYFIRGSQLADTSIIQHARIDVGSGSAESVVTAANPLPVTGTTCPTVDEDDAIDTNTQGILSFFRSTSDTAKAPRVTGDGSVKCFLVAEGPGLVEYNLISDGDALYVKQWDDTSSGSLACTSTSSTFSIPGDWGVGSVGFELSGTWTATIRMQVANASGWVDVPVFSYSTNNLITDITANGIYAVSIAGSSARLKVAVANSGTASVICRVTSAANCVRLNAPLPTGTNAIGTVVVSSITASAATLPAYGEIVAASLTSSYQTVVAMGGNALSITLTNSTDQDLIFSLDSGTTAHYKLPPYTIRSFDFASLARYATSANIQVKHAGTAPVVGSALADVVR